MAMRVPLNCITVAFGVLVAFGVAAATHLQAEPIPAGDIPEPTGTTDQQIPEVVDAVTAFKDRDFDGALKLLKEAVKKHADLPPAQVIMAQLFSQVRQAAGMRSSLERAVIDAPDDPEAYVILGDFALRGRRVTEADLLYAKAAALTKGFTGSAKRKKILEPRIYGGLAAVAEARQDWSTAQKYLNDWLKIDPKSAVAMQRLGRALFQQKKANEAYEQLKAAAAADPENVLTPAARLAQFYEQAGDHEAAKKWMTYALQSAPKKLRTRLVAAQWALETDQLKEAQTQAAAAMQIDPKSLEAKVLRGVIALFQKDYQAAESYFEAAHLQSPGNFAASNNLALALVEQNDESKKRRALEYAQSNARQYPRVVEAGSTYGWVLYKLDRLDEAERVLRQTATSGNLSADTAYYIAQVSADRGRKEEAKQLLESALKSKRPFSKREEAQALLKKVSQ